jgi:uncharacterized protein HemX
MRTRFAILTTALLLLATAAPALAQVGQNPFDNITPEPTETPTPAGVDTSTDQTGRNTLYVIGAVLVVAFAGIGIWIARDARRNLPEELRDSGRQRDQGPHKHEREAKAKARAKGRAQRQARKAGRKAKR